MIHKKCKRTNGEICCCAKCGCRLCKPIEGGREIIGHYVFDEELYCIECWNKRSIYRKE